LHLRRRGYHETRSIEGTSPDQPVDSVTNNLLVSIPLEESLRTSHLPDLFRDLVNRLRYPLPGRGLASPAAAAHGLVRRRQGYSAAMPVEESRMLEVSIFHALDINAHRIDFNVLLPGRWKTIPLYKALAA
jgi:hypothetical protein